MPVTEGAGVCPTLIAETVNDGSSSILLIVKVSVHDKPKYLSVGSRITNTSYVPSAEGTVVE